MKIELIKGDITKMEVDAIVNAANSSLLGGGGVDGAIHRAGGTTILEECMAIRNRQGGCPTGKAVITNAGNLPAKKVIHTVGPVWNNRQSNEDEKLRNCYLNSLRIAEENGLRSIAFPNISTGVYRFPKGDAAKIAIETVEGFSSSIIEQVVFVCFDAENFDLYKSKLNPITQLEKDKKEIDIIVNRFFDLFTNKNGQTPNVQHIKQLFLPKGNLINNTTAQPVIYDLDSFIEPRVIMLSDGTLTDFVEKETSEATEIYGNIAQRASVYEKSGKLNGTYFEGKGKKLMQFIKQNNRWMFASVVWRDNL